MSEENECTVPSNAREQGQPEKEWIQRAKEGDQKAWQSLFDLHGEPLWEWLWNQDVSEADACDIAQRSWEKAIKKLSQWRGEGTFFAFLKGIAKKEMCEMYRQKQRQREFYREWEALFESQRIEKEGQNRPENRMVLQQKRQFVQQVLKKLKATHRDVLRLRYCEEQSHEEIAQQIQLPVTTVKSRLFKARAKFMETAQSMDDGGELD